MSHFCQANAKKEKGDSCESPAVLRPSEGHKLFAGEAYLPLPVPVFSADAAPAFFGMLR
jgi:hypothetical protein